MSTNWPFPRATTMSGAAAPSGDDLYSAIRSGEVRRNQEERRRNAERARRAQEAEPARQRRESEQLRAAQARGGEGTAHGSLGRGTPNFYLPIAEAATAINDIPDHLLAYLGDDAAADRLATAPYRALNQSRRLRGFGEFLLGPEEITGSAIRLGSGTGDGWDVFNVAATVLPPAARPLARKVNEYAVQPLRRALGRAPAETPRPSYSVREQGPALVVRREGMTPEVNPSLAEGDIADLRSRMADPEQNAALRLANAEAVERRGAPLDLSNAPQTSLRRQGGIARMFDAAVEGDPAYKSALFERYGQMMPEVVEQARAQNYDQLTEAAYRQLAQEAQQQFDRLPVGMNYHYGELEYPTPSAMFRDALGRGNLNVFRGGDPHPFLSDIDPATGLTGNEQFRAVHDYIGHGASGSTFRPGGEEIAYATHAQTLSPLAQMALLSETRGQNSWVNYGPANVDLIGEMEAVRGRLAGASGAEADTLRAQLRDLGSQFQYAAQEPVLLPPDYLDINSAGGVPDWARGLIVPRAPVSAPGVHYSRMEGLERTDPSFYGTGHIGQERRMVRREKLPDRTYFYSQGADGRPVTPEEPVAMRAPYIYDAELSGMYDVNTDPERLVALANLYRGDGSALPDLERLVRDYGYSGYISDYGDQRAAAMFEPVNVRQR